VATAIPATAPVVMIAAGKAAPAMARAAAALLARALRAGLIIAPDPAHPAPPLVHMTAEHPQPGPGSEAAGRHALEMASRLAPGDRLLVLLSGGASSLMAAPAPGLSLQDKRIATGLLLNGGADIHALNTVRKHLSALKGGQLAAACPAPCLALAISDVVGDDPSVIGSGPTVADPSTFADAGAVLRRVGGLDAYPRGMVRRIAGGERGEYPETPKPGDPRLERTRTLVIGGRHDAMCGAADAARAHGYRVVVFEEPVVGEARHAARSHLARVLEAARTTPPPVCVISSGETTVAVRGSGRGGRNQEFALALVDALERAPFDLQVASVGTDGVDGPTDAAGAIVDATSRGRARRAGLPDPEAFLDRNDAYAFFDAIDDLIRTGPTQTNVGDLQIALVRDNQPGSRLPREA
jgi:hydroxypyruvate reductase